MNALRTKRNKMKKRKMAWHAYRLWAVDREWSFDWQRKPNSLLWWCSCNSMCRPFSWYVVVPDSAESFLRRIRVVQLVSRRPMPHRICAQFGENYIIWMSFQLLSVDWLTFCANENWRMWNFFPRIRQRIDYRREWCDRSRCPNICHTIGAIPLATAVLPCKRWLKWRCICMFAQCAWWHFHSHSDRRVCEICEWQSIQANRMNGKVLTVLVTYAISTSQAYSLRDMCNCWPIMHTWIRLRTRHVQQI